VSHATLFATARLGRRSDVDLQNSLVYKINSMDSSKFAFKFFLENPAALKPGEVVPVFHNFIQTHGVPDHLLIDVADYEHVPNGPGTVLVSHEANIHLDLADGRPGLLYVRKQPLKGDMRERIRAGCAMRWRSRCG